MTKYKVYPEYKDSGVEWLGDIPRGWTISRVKYLAPFQVGWTPSTKNDANFIGDNLWVNISDLKEKFISSTAKCISDKAAKEASMDITPRGSLLYSFKLSVGAVSFAGCDLYTNEAIASFLNYAHLPLSYLYYALPIFIIESASTNIYGAKILNQELIKNAFLLAPSHSEAEKVANFLDHETAKIDNMIEKQQQLIELLKEKRQAVISHAVTKGLNPDVPMKDSGIEWLGEVPEHWTVSTIKYIATFIGTGSTPKNSESFTDGDGIDWLSPGDFNDSLTLRNAKKKITTQAVSNGDAKIYPKNSIVVIGIGATLGKVAFVEHEFSCNQQINIITPSEIVEHKYLTYSLLNQVEQMKQSSNASTIGIMNQEKTKKIWIVFPPKDEQIKIASVLYQKEIEFDSLLNKSENQILLLQERRTALISAAVTGKIDVRDWVAPDMQDAEEPQETTA